MLVTVQAPSQAQLVWEIADDEVLETQGSRVTFADVRGEMVTVYLENVLSLQVGPGGWHDYQRPL